jgi:uncharacterized membrane-anchored protein YhcB (DUF1043 family)
MKKEKITPSTKTSRKAVRKELKSKLNLELAAIVKDLAPSSRKLEKAIAESAKALAKILSAKVTSKEKQEVASEA